MLFSSNSTNELAIHKLSLSTFFIERDSTKPQTWICDDSGIFPSTYEMAVHFTQLSYDLDPYHWLSVRYSLNFFREFGPIVIRTMIFFPDLKNLWVSGKGNRVRTYICRRFMQTSRWRYSQLGHFRSPYFQLSLSWTTVLRSDERLELITNQKHIMIGLEEGYKPYRIHCQGSPK